MALRLYVAVFYAVLHWSVAVALATLVGNTEWQQRCAFKAIGQCFNNWFWQWPAQRSHRITTSNRLAEIASIRPKEGGKT